MRLGDRHNTTRTAQAIDAAEPFSKQIAPIERGHMWAIGVGWSCFPEHCAPVEMQPSLELRCMCLGQFPPNDVFV